ERRSRVLEEADDLKAPRDLDRAVLGAVVDHDDLTDTRLLRRGDCPGVVVLPVQDRQHDADHARVPAPAAASRIASGIASTSGPTSNSRVGTARTSRPIASNLAAS